MKKVLIDTKKGYDESLPYHIVRITEAGPVTEVLHLVNKSTGNGLKKLNADEYVVMKTGEVLEYIHTQNRAQNIGNVKRTLRNIRLLVNTNIKDASKVTWITLTYADNMTDREVLHRDFKVFMLRFKRWCKKHGYPCPEYIAVAEPQGRGAWHIHMFFIWQIIAPFMDNNTIIAKLWGHGFTKTKKLNDVDNIGAYFSAYLADIPLDEAIKLPKEEYNLMKCNAQVFKSFEDNGETIKDKKFIKGGRLYLYPTNMCIVRHSRGIKYPSTMEISQEDYDIEIKGKEKSLYGTQTFSSTSKIFSNDDSTPINAIGREYYNINRKEAQINE